jgi:hypothetical protein
VVNDIIGLIKVERGQNRLRVPPLPSFAAALSHLFFSAGIVFRLRLRCPPIGFQEEEIVVFILFAVWEACFV